MFTMKLWRYVAVLLLVALGPCFAHGTDVAILRNGFSISHERREVIGSVTRLYLGTDDNGYVDIPTVEIERFEDGPSATSVPTAVSQPLPDMINAISDRHHLDPDLINSVIHAESGFNPRAVSPKGARGLMQLMPRTASDLGVTDAFDPGANVEGGTRYLSDLLVRYDFDLIKALAAYNAGPERVEKYHGVPPYYETQAYVAKIVRDFNRKKLAEQKAASAAKTGHHKVSLQRTSAPKPAAAGEIRENASQ
jgi:membrane-bound lytic murein transglycosylase MltF